MLDRQLHRARVVSSVAATLISLACGTNVSSFSVVWTSGYLHSGRTAP